MLEFTGHPLFDVGVATILAFVSKDDPAELTTEDLDKVADYIEHEYVRPPLVSFLTVAFTSTAWFCQDAYNPNKPGLSDVKRQARLDKRNQMAAHHLRQRTCPGDGNPEEQGVFTGKPSISVALSGKLQPGRAGRAQIPLALGDEYINFLADGNPGLPVSGEGLLCLQFLPLGCAKCGGRLLGVHSDNQELILHFAASFLQENRKAIQLTQTSGETKMPEARFFHRTLLVDTLLQARQRQQEALEDKKPFSITAYHFSNSGQGPKLDIYHLPMETINFLSDMQTANFQTNWNQIVHRAWEVAPPKKGGDKESESTFQPRRNWLYEDLFGLPDNALKFLRTYFLRIALRYAQGKTDPRTNYSLQTEANLVSWKLTERFLRRILHMETERIEQIRNLGDRLAEYIHKQNDRFLFANFRIKNYHHFRTSLLRASLAEVKRGNPPIVEFDPYIEVFERAENDAHPDWQLARDLIMIRMIERLYDLGWLGANTDVVSDIDDQVQEDLEIKS